MESFYLAPLSRSMCVSCKTTSEQRQEVINDLPALQPTHPLSIILLFSSSWCPQPLPLYYTLRQAGMAVHLRDPFLFPLHSNVQLKPCVHLVFSFFLHYVKDKSHLQLRPPSISSFHKSLTRLSCLKDDPWPPTNKNWPSGKHLAKVMMSNEFVQKKLVKYRQFFASWIYHTGIFGLAKCLQLFVSCSVQSGWHVVHLFNAVKLPCKSILTSWTFHLFQISTSVLYEFYWNIRPTACGKASSHHDVTTMFHNLMRS